MSSQQQCSPPQRNLCSLQQQASMVYKQITAQQQPGSLWLRDYREGWPLLTVESEVNGDSKSTNESGPSLVGSLGLSCWYMRLLSCLDCSSRSGTKYFFLTVHYFSSFGPIAQQAGKAAVLGHLSPSMLVYDSGLWVNSNFGVLSTSDFSHFFTLVSLLSLHTTFFKDCYTVVLL